MNKNKTLLNTFVNQSIKKYTDFMGIDKFPQFNIIEKNMSIPHALNKGFGSFATHLYDIPTGRHRLEIWSDIYTPQLNTEYVLFHEFTHMLDSEMYINKDKIKNAKYKGFTEYHASQIDFLKILGAKQIGEDLIFSMKDRFVTIDDPKCAEELFISSHQAATSLVNRRDFPYDIETLITTIGMIFNYWGRRSICKMYASDYIEKINNVAIENFIGTECFRALDGFMNGWMGESQIAIIGDVYINLVATKIKEFNL